MKNQFKEFWRNKSLAGKLDQGDFSGHYKDHHYNVRSGQVSIDDRPFKNLNGDSKWEMKQEVENLIDNL